MPLPIGTRLGPYEIVAPLGAGGMGEVYRARDPRLEREVAIKVLPAETAADPETLARFSREARAVAALVHPNLLALYDVGSEGTIAYAVTELLEGETLRARLARGAIPAPEALAIARQVARGMAAANDKGIVHRDLKPENLFLAPDGHVKVLDFGLAKRDTVVAPGAAPVVALTTMTAPGTILGTLGYLAPEQLTGRTVDARSDVFSFGAVLYEMLTGTRAFGGGSDAERMAAILMNDPPAVPASLPGLPPTLPALVARCLAKDPASRDPDFHAVLAELDRADPTPAIAGATRARAPSRRPLALAAAALVALVLVALGVGLARRRAADPKPARAPVPEHAIAMLDFENLTGDRALDWIGRGIPELLGTALARSSELDVYDPQRLANLLTGAGHASDTTASVYERLRARGVGRAVVGSILRSGADLRIQCRVVDVASGAVLHADATQGPATQDIFQLAGGLIPKLQTWLEIDLTGAGAGDRWLRELTTSSSDAFRLYLRGHEAMMASRWRESANYDEQSLALDSSFVAARVDLTACYWNLGDDARTRQSLAAAKRLRRAASTREALQLDMIDAVISENPQRLIQVASSLRELYPENRFFAYLVGRGYFTAGEWDRCIAVLDPLVRERWTWAWTYVLASRSYARLGRIDEARRTLAIGMDVTHHNPELAEVDATFLAEQGDTTTARDVLIEASHSPELVETPGFESEIRLTLGRIYEGEGRADSARAQYQRALAVVPAGFEHRRELEAGLQRTSGASQGATRRP